MDRALHPADDLPPARPSLKDFANFAGGLGVRLVEWELDHAVVELDVADRHLNGLGVVHGGVIATLIDIACAHSGIYCTVPGNRRSGMTASLSINLMGAARGGRITAVARKKGGGKTLYMASGEAFDGYGKLIATGEAVCRYRNGSDRPEGTPE